MEIEYFEFEDRKRVQLIVTELFNTSSEIMVEALHPKRKDVAKQLLEKYTLPGMATFVGSLIRLFTRSSVSILIYSDLKFILIYF